MESTLTEFLTTHLIPFFVFALVVYALSELSRRFAEFIHPKLLDQELLRGKVWRELALPIVPVLIGMLLVLFLPNFPTPLEFNVWAGRMMYGALLGFFSTWVYRILKAVLQRKWEVVLPDFGSNPEEKE